MIGRGDQHLGGRTGHVLLIDQIHRPIRTSTETRIDGDVDELAETVGHVLLQWLGCHGPTVRPSSTVAGRYGKPLVTAGFESLDILQAIAMLLPWMREGRCEIENQYGRVVRAEGNPVAPQLMRETFAPLRREVAVTLGPFFGR